MQFVSEKLLNMFFRHFRLFPGFRDRPKLKEPKNEKGKFTLSFARLMGTAKYILITIWAPNYFPSSKAPPGTISTHRKDSDRGGYGMGF